MIYLHKNDVLRIICVCILNQLFFVSVAYGLLPPVPSSQALPRYICRCRLYCSKLTLMRRKNNKSGIIRCGVNCEQSQACMWAFGMITLHRKLRLIQHTRLTQFAHRLSYDVACQCPQTSLMLRFLQPLDCSPRRASRGLAGKISLQKQSSHRPFGCCGTPQRRGS